MSLSKPFREELASDVYDPRRLPVVHPGAEVREVPSERQHPAGETPSQKAS